MFKVSKNLSPQLVTEIFEKRNNAHEGYKNRSYKMLDSHKSFKLKPRIVMNVCFYPFYFIQLSFNLVYFLLL